MSKIAEDEQGPHEPPIEITIHWCSVCGSKFLHYLGSRHIRQNGVGGECWGKTKPLQFVR